MEFGFVIMLRVLAGGFGVVYSRTGLSLGGTEKAKKGGTSSGVAFKCHTLNSGPNSAGHRL